jgi:hypothetical protein
MEIEYDWLAICGRLQDALRAHVHASFEVTPDFTAETGLLIEATDAFTVTWTRPALRDFLGFTGNLSGSNRYGATTPSSKALSVTAMDRTPEIIYATKKNDRKSSLYFAKQMRWRFSLRVTASELPGLRAVLNNALRGSPLTIYWNTGVLSAWTWSNFTGKTKCILRDAVYAETWLTSPHQTIADIQLEVDVIE